MILRLQTRHLLKLERALLLRTWSGVFPFEVDFGPSDIRLSPGARRLAEIPNAGGNSLQSEIISFEVLQRLLGPEKLSLDKTEMQLRYYPWGKITDYSCWFQCDRIGVSVTRAFRWSSQAYSHEEGCRLLRRKLHGVNESSSHVIGKFTKQILFVWVRSMSVAKILQKCYYSLSKELRSNTIVVVAGPTSSASASGWSSIFGNERQRTCMALSKHKR